MIEKKTAENSSLRIVALCSYFFVFKHVLYFWLFLIDSLCCTHVFFVFFARNALTICMMTVMMNAYQHIYSLRLTVHVIPISKICTAYKLLIISLCNTDGIFTSSNDILLYIPLVIKAGKSPPPGGR